MGNLGNSTQSLEQISNKDKSLNYTISSNNIKLVNSYTQTTYRQPTNTTSSPDPNMSKKHLPLHAKDDCQMVENLEHVVSNKSPQNHIKTYTPLHSLSGQNYTTIGIINPTTTPPSNTTTIKDNKTIKISIKEKDAKITIHGMAEAVQVSTCPSPSKEHKHGQLTTTTTLLPQPTSHLDVLLSTTKLPMKLLARRGPIGPCHNLQYPNQWERNGGDNNSKHTLPSPTNLRREAHCHEQLHKQSLDQ